MKKLFTLLTLALFAVSGAWSADYTAPATKTYGELKFLDVAGTDANVTVSSDNYLTYGAYYIGVVLKVTDWYNASDDNPAGNKENGVVGDFSAQGFIKVTDTAQDNTNGNAGLKLNSGRIRYYYVTGATSVAGLVKDNGSTKYVQLKIQEVASDGSLGDATTIDGNKTTAQYVIDGGALDPSKYYKISFTSNNTGNCVIYQIRLGKAPAVAVDPVFSLTKTTIGTDETSQIQVGSKGNLDGITFNGDVTFGTAGVVTVNATGLVTPVAPGTTTINFNTNAVSEKYNASTSNSLSITVTAPVVATPEITPADGSRFFGASQEITITSATDGASIYYTTDGSTPTASSTLYNSEDKPVITATTTIKAIAAKVGCTDSEVATATITKFVKSDLTSISTNATWNFNKLTANTSHAYYSSGIKLTDSTFPKKTDLDYFVYEDFKGDFFTIADGFDGTTIAFSQTEYPIRDNSFMQGTNLKFNTTVPGIVTVTYSNTGNRDKEDDRRFLTINGTKYGVGTMKSNANVTTSVPVAAGDVVIGGVLKKDESVQYLRIYSVSFSTTTSASISEYEWVTYVSEAPLDFSGVANLSAYIVTGHSGNAITTTKMTSTVPANTPLLLSGAEGDYNIPVAGSSSTDVSANKLKAGTGAVVASESGKTKYVLSVSGGKAAFKKINATDATVPVGKAYLQFDETIEAPVFDLDGEATGIKAVENNNVENNKFYNLAGQQVTQPTKGLYIVNGKKVIIK